MRSSSRWSSPGPTVSPGRGSPGSPRRIHRSPPEPSEEPPGVRGGRLGWFQYLSLARHHRNLETRLECMKCL
ncbi:hypothetical protein NDU88_008033 [Pleurodeles waltl]|uniref:Uncharacterized protein n=1 Tax=Pleurodeles waltl TaxID=8319 RepID=A0AAV7SU45_PLEWA|nr:hypothetical protein NDU88_008033 [Pleurodeles waltl]